MATQGLGTMIIPRSERRGSIALVLLVAVLLVAAAGENADARVALWTLRACASFDLYLRKNHGPFAEDAREHLTELRRAFGR